MISTNNFNPVTDPKLLCTCGHPDCDERSIDQDTLDKVQLIRTDLRQSMTVTSGGRCSHHPNEITKSSPGDHQLRKGIDVECYSESHAIKLIGLAGRHGASRIAGGAYCGFVHMAWRETDRTDIPTWSY